jgi:Ca2+-transporting ATPase
MSSTKSLLKIGPFSNGQLNKAALISTALVALVLFTPLSIPFGLVNLPAHMYLIGLGLAFVPLVVMEFSKLFGLTKYFEKKTKQK